MIAFVCHVSPAVGPSFALHKPYQAFLKTLCPSKLTFNQSSSVIGRKKDVFHCEVLKVLRAMVRLAATVVEKFI